MSLDSCATCPSALTAEEARAFFNEPDIGTGMCARFGHLLARINTAGDVDLEDEIAMHYAKICSFHNIARPTKPISDGFNPVYFDIDVDAINNPKNDALVDNCLDCANCFIDNATGHYGCRARGVVVFLTKTKQQAKGCDWREHTTLGYVPNVPYYPLAIPFCDMIGTASAPATPRAAPPPPKSLFALIDPVDYNSDLPVDAVDQNKIRAYREVQGPKQKYYLPIFRTDYFDPEAQDLIPKAGNSEDGYELGDPSLYVDYTGLVARFMAVSYTLDMGTLTLVGEPGSGKTEGVRHLAWMMNMPFVHIGFNEFTDPEEIFGQPAASQGTTYIQEGLLPKWWESNGAVILSDEWNLGMAGIQQRYRQMNDASREILVYGRRYKRGADVFHLAAINPAHDFLNLGAKELASADVRRLTFHHMPTVDEATHAAIITETVKRLQGIDIEPKLVNVIQKISKDLRAMVMNGKLPHHWSISQDLKVALLALHLPLKEAYSVAYLDYIDPEMAQVAMAAIGSYIPANSNF